MSRNSKDRVVITGMGIISCTGNTVNEFWNSLLNGESGIDYLTQLNTDDYSCKIGGEIKNFDPFVLSVVNESSMHNVPQGSESHFKVLIVSDDFKNINNIKRHQTVYKALKSVMESIHALSISSLYLHLT